MTNAGPVRKAPLRSLPAFDATLAYYPPGMEQQRHDHDRSLFSLVLAGSLNEEVEGRDHSAGPGEAACKPCGTVHADRYGPHGALLLSFRIHCNETATRAVGRHDWHWRTASAVIPAIDPEQLRAGKFDDELLWDILGSGERRTSAGQPPDWLRWARAELDRRDSPAVITALAAEAGVHRVHFTRQFIRHYGLAPTAYRRRQMAMRALSAIIDNLATPAAAAHDAGFADQSHMARAIRTAFGTTPRKITEMLRN